MLAREFEKIDDKADWQKHLISDWKDAATVGYIGCVPSYLDDYFNTPARIDLLRTALKTIISGLAAADFLSLSDLNDNQVGMGDWGHVNTQGFRNTAQLMLDLIDGKLTTDASSPIDYWDFG
ncbi:MAG: hypothetical protein H7Z72_20825 [Bacteroidetes bacterium]|nr:hypothetical protein [Fibrella sp.]